MALKIKQNGEVKDLIIPACGVEVLDMEDNFGSSNLEEVLQELGDSDSVYISDETPDKDGIWISSDNTSTVAQENPILVELKDYVNEKTDEIKTTVDSINDKMSEYYSLKDAKAIPENADLNDYVEFGNYQCESGNRATTLSNCPYTAGGFVLHVERTTGGTNGYCRQTLVCNGHGRTFVRNMVDRTWSKWVCVQYMYTNVSQLGLTVDNTIADVVRTMANHSTLSMVFGSDNNSTVLGRQMPTNYGTLFIIKYDVSRTIIEFNSSANGDTTVVTQKFYCNYNSTAQTISDWVVSVTSNQISRPNILINGDFQIWQRGTSFTHKHGAYCADRWMMYMSGNVHGNVTYTKTDNGLKINCTKAITAAHARIWQPMDSIDRVKLNGKKITYTIKYRNNVNKAYLLTCADAVALPKSTDWNVISYTSVFTNSNQWFAGVQFGASDYSMALNEYIEIAYIKAEVGEYSTSFVAKTKAEELRDCARYYTIAQIPQTVVTCETNQIVTVVNVPVPMRVSPTITLTHDCYFQKVSGGSPILLRSSGDKLSVSEWKENSTSYLVWIWNSSDAPSGLATSTTGVINCSGSANNRLSGATWMTLDAEIY